MNEILRNLQRPLRVVVKVDQLTLAPRTFDSKAEDEKQTKDASGWLEVGPAVTAEVREKDRWADFALRSIEDASGSNVTKVTAVREGADDVRTASRCRGRDRAERIRPHWNQGGRGARHHI